MQFPKRAFVALAILSLLVGVTPDRAAAQIEVAVGSVWKLEIHIDDVHVTADTDPGLSGDPDVFAEITVRDATLAQAQAEGPLGITVQADAGQTQSTPVETGGVSTHHFGSHTMLFDKASLFGTFSIEARVWDDDAWFTFGDDEMAGGRNDIRCRQESQRESFQVTGSAATIKYTVHCKKKSSHLSDMGGHAVRYTGSLQPSVLTAANPVANPVNLVVFPEPGAVIMSAKLVEIVTGKATVVLVSPAATVTTVGGADSVLHRIEWTLTPAQFADPPIDIEYSVALPPNVKRSRVSGYLDITFISSLGGAPQTKRIVTEGTPVLALR